MPIMKTVVLAYSGGLDTSVCIPLLSGGYGYDQAITAVADGGQPAPKDIEAGDRNQHKCLWRGLAKDMCDCVIRNRLRTLRINVLIRVKSNCVSKYDQL